MRVSRVRTGAIAGLVATVVATAAPTIAHAAEAPRSIASDTPSQIVSTSIHAAVAQKSVRVSCTTSIAALGVSASQTSDAGPNYGTQSMVLTLKGTPGTGNGTARVVNGVAYFKGNAEFLFLNFGVRNSKYANEWISIKPGQRNFATVSDGLTMSTVPSQLTPIGQLTKSSIVHVAGQSVVVVSGSTSAPMNVGTGKVHLFVSTTAPYLPVQETIQSKPSPSTNFVGTCSLSHWKESFTVSKPSTSTPITQTNL